MTTRTNSLNKTTSWIIRNKQTKEVLLETFDTKLVQALNTVIYEAVPILDYLQEIARK